MIKLSKIARCIGLSGNISVRRDFLGYAANFTGSNRSLLEQVRLLQNRHISLNIILVGVENFTAQDISDIDFAVHAARNTYATVNVGIGRVEHFSINVADANGMDIINNDAEAVSLTKEWTIPNNSLDVFFVLNEWILPFLDASGNPVLDASGNPVGQIRLGLSEVKGPCDKATAAVMSGSVVVLSTPATLTGQALAHELGHYLGLKHICELLGPPVNGVIPPGGCNPLNIRPRNAPLGRIYENDWLMYPSGPNGGKLSDPDGAIMRDHCLAKDGCAGN